MPFTSAVVSRTVEAGLPRLAKKLLPPPRKFSIVTSIRQTQPSAPFGVPETVTLVIDVTGGAAAAGRASIETTSRVARVTTSRVERTPAGGRRESEDTATPFPLPLTSRWHPRGRGFLLIDVLAEKLRRPTSSRSSQWSSSRGRRGGATRRRTPAPPGKAAWWTMLGRQPSRLAATKSRNSPTSSVLTTLARSTQPR